ncbi:MAG: PilZ domain-containing protein [Proteocatella sp.]
MSNELLSDNNIQIDDDFKGDKSKEPYKNVIISDENGNELLGAYLDYVGSKIAVIQLLSIWDVKIIKELSTLYFKSLEKYDQIYRGTVEYIDGNAVFFKDFENISNELKNDLKVDYIYKTKITVIDEDEDGENISIPVIIKDVSCGGVCFFTLESLRLGQIVEIVFEFTKNPLPVKLQIIRKERYAGDRNFYYGCRVISLNMFQESILKQAIFRIDIENKRAKSIFDQDVEIKDEVGAGTDSGLE